MGWDGIEDHFRQEQLMLISFKKKKGFIANKLGSRIVLMLVGFICLDGFKSMAGSK